MSALRELTREELAAAPVIWKENSAGAKIKVRDPKWIARQQAKPFSSSKPKAPSKVIGDDPDKVLREVAKAYALPEHLIRSRDMTYVTEAIHHTVAQLSRRCPQLSHAAIAEMVGITDRTSVSRILSNWKPCKRESESSHV